MSKTILNKTAVLLALTIGTMAVIAGGRVLVGIDPGYTVIDWLPVYNFSMGIITALVTSVLLWKNHRFALAAAGITFGLHACVMLVLQTTVRKTVAAESIQAMTVRLIVWGIILVLLFLQSRIGKTTQGWGESNAKGAQEKT